MAFARVSAKRGAYKSNRRLEGGQMQEFERDGVSDLLLGGSAVAAGASRLRSRRLPDWPAGPRMICSRRKRVTTGRRKRVTTDYDRRGGELPYLETGNQRLETRSGICNLSSSAEIIPWVRDWKLETGKRYVRALGGEIDCYLRISAPSAVIHIHEYKYETNGTLVPPSSSIRSELQIIYRQAFTIESS